ncbi:MAG: GNAT family N-acetyltransferase [Oscillospiraceae bacterium]|jgi:ribosomal protein S18 acetylase RimI-like enzyme|nr:GNAT family N-acetyltransferase [Oscillospiraceae bacterium]
MLHLYDPAYLAMKKELALADGEGNAGEFKAFTYKNSLRFSVLLREAPGEEMTGLLLKEIKRCGRACMKRKVLLWYSQAEGFSTVLLDRLGKYSDPYRFFLFRLERDAIGTDVDMKGLRAEKCTPDRIDACIDVMEEAFTPFPDAPGSFRGDRERIAGEFLCENGGAVLFFKGDDLVGFCGHKQGYLTEVAVRRGYQGQGYGEAMLRAVLRAIREMGYDAELCVRHDNARAIGLYRKVGFKKVYESMRVKLK